MKDAKNPELIENKDITENNLTKDQMIGANGSHEYEHATNPNDVKVIKKGETMKKNAPEHKPAYDKGRKAAEEYGKLNRKK
jgi:hypothetical protein